MSNKRIFSPLNLCFVFIFFATVSAFGENRFEGANIVLNVPDKHTALACSLRYVPPTTEITITDLDRSTPLKISSCSGPQGFAGSGSNVVQNSAGTARLTASPTDYKWCFVGEDKRYEIAFKGDVLSGPVKYNWIATPEPRELGFYNVRDFGAKGDGIADDTVAVQSALAFAGFRNGGTITFPDGDFVVSSTVVIPSNVIIHGAGGFESGAPTNNIVTRGATRIRLRGQNKALFRIGECSFKIVIRDVELYADSNENTYGVEGVGAYTTAQGFNFERVVFQNFFRGIYVHGLPQTDLGWQFDYVKVEQCRFIYNRDAGIYTNSRNSDWQIESSLFFVPVAKPGQNADGMHFERVLIVLIQNTFGGGLPNAVGGTFINILDSGATTILNSQAENMTYTLRYNAIDHPAAGDYSGPLTLINNMFGDRIEFKARRTLVSMGNYYEPSTFKADKMLRVYSTGDRFCYDGIILGCRRAVNNFDGATIIFMTGQLGEGSVKGHPTYFGTDVQFGEPPQMPSIAQTALPSNKPNGSLIYCNNCRRNTTPCQAGGSGAPAMVVNNQWSCL